MVMNIQLFILGYLVNAVIWRIDQGRTDEIAIPAVLAALTCAIIGIEVIRKRQ